MLSVICRRRCPQTQTLLVAITVLVGIAKLVSVMLKIKNVSLAASETNNQESVNWYAVFSASTPNGDTHRSYDYAFYLPLTALAWERIGFKSIVILAGRRCEWDEDPALSLILTRLEVDRKAVVIFLDAPMNNRVMIGQTSRLFAANLKEFPGREGDYLITSDADLWPLRREHYIPRRGYNLVSVNSDCCGFFNVSWRGSQSFHLYPMGYIGANVSTWRQIMNQDGHFATASDSTSILKYYEEEGFGKAVHRKVAFAAELWDLDQRMISIRIQDWMDRYDRNGSSIFRVPNLEFTRTDRINWDGDLIDAIDLEKRYDAHLPLKPFLPQQWRLIEPLVDLMYGGNESLQSRWCKDYAAQFQKAVKSYIHFSDPDFDNKAETDYT